MAAPNTTPQTTTTTSTTRTLPDYTRTFLKFCTTSRALTFGDYTLKSGRKSPYFFNIGNFHHAAPLSSLSTAFAHAIANHDHPEAFDFEVIFGPAYKGIPLCTTTTEKLATLYPSRYSNISYAFNRKEVKTHGDGGSIVGSPLRGKRVLIIDDVITAGTAIREAVDIIEKEGGILAGVVVAIDRQEVAPSSEEQGDGARLSAVGEVRRRYGVPVVAVLTFADIIEGGAEFASEADVKAMEEYKQKYGASG